MPLHIIIDGYNLIRASDKLSEIDMCDITRGRDVLIDMLAAYKKIKHHKITVVFDGTNAHPFSTCNDQQKGIRIKFSVQGELADSVIKKMSQFDREKALIVSSDKEIIDFCMSMGSTVIGSLEFEEKLFMASYLMEKGLEENHEDKKNWDFTTKKKGPKHRLSKKKRKNILKVKKL